MKASKMRPNGMTRLIQRNEFEKRLADYSVNILKSFQTVLGHIELLQRQIDELRGGGQPSATDTTDSHAREGDPISARSPGSVPTDSEGAE